MAISLVEGVRRGNVTPDEVVDPRRWPNEIVLPDGEPDDTRACDGNDYLNACVTLQNRVRFLPAEP
jgi:hypothetical protein